MTTYNERLNDILSKTPCVQCDGSGAYPDYDGEPVQCQFCWQLRFTFIDKAKQALASLTNELVAEARIDPFEFVESCEPDCDDVRHAYHKGQWDMATRIKAQQEEL